MKRKVTEGEYEFREKVEYRKSREHWGVESRGECGVQESMGYWVNGEYREGESGEHGDW